MWLSLPFTEVYCYKVSRRFKSTVELKIYMTIVVVVILLQCGVDGTIQCKRRKIKKYI